jgi:uncharacterized coiled-coil protein SlyX
MEMVRTVVVNAYQAARLRGEGYVAAFDKALAIYRELSPHVAPEYARAEVERLLSVRLPAEAEVTPSAREQSDGREPALAAMEMAELRRRLDTLERRQNDFDRTLTLIQQDTGETRHMLASISARLDRLVERAEAPSGRSEPPRPEPDYHHEEAAAPHRHHAGADMPEPVPMWIAWPMWSLWMWSWWLSLLTRNAPRR